MQKKITHLALAALFVIGLAGTVGSSAKADKGSSSTDWGYDGPATDYNSSGGAGSHTSAGSAGSSSADSGSGAESPSDSLNIPPTDGFNSSLDSLDARLGGHAGSSDSDDSPSEAASAQTANSSNQKHSILEVTDETADQEIFFETRPVFVDFYTTWCGPCKKLSPVIEELSEEYKDKVKFVKVNAEKATKLAYKYEVMAYPTMKLIAPKSKKAKTLIGYHDIARIRLFVDKALKESK